MDRIEFLDNLVKKINRELRDNGFLLTIITIQDQVNPDIEFIGSLGKKQYHDLVRRHVSELTVTVAGWSE